MNNKTNNKRLNTVPLEAVAHQPNAHIISDRAWMWLSLCVLLIAAALRLYMLELKPLHHDEGVNGFFLTNLWKNGTYAYDPANYHGPTLYYLTLPLLALFGLETWALRLLVVLFGMGTILLMLSLSRHIGRVGALTAAALVAVSPGAVFFSRYYIHETLFVFFTLAAVVSWLRFVETTRAIYFLLAALTLALLFATKETAFISLGVLLIAAAMTHVYFRLFDRPQTRTHAKHGKQEPASIFSFDAERFGGTSRLAMLSLGGAVLFAGVNILFYSSFFTNAKGITDSLATFAIWQRTGTSDFHAKPLFTYFRWLGKEELALLLVGGAGALWAVLRRTNRFAIFAALWAGGIIMAYSLVPYKTPWLALNFIPPLALVGGYLVESLAARFVPRDVSDGASNLLLLTLVPVCLLALGVGAYRSVILNFDRFDDDRYTYVYAHSTRDLTKLADDVDALVQRSGGTATIGIHSTDYWPLPWYFRDYKVVSYPPQPIATATGTLLIVSAAQATEARTALAGRYTEIGRYNLRPGVQIVLLAKPEIARQVNP